MKASEYAIRYKDGVMSSDYDTCVKAVRQLVDDLINETVELSKKRGESISVFAGVVREINQKYNAIVDRLQGCCLRRNAFIVAIVKIFPELKPFVPKYALETEVGNQIMAEQELLLVSSVFSLVNEGVKKSTLRKGRRDIRTGPLTFKMTENENCTVKVNVLNVSYLPFSEISEKHAKSEGYDSVDELKNVIRQIYGDVNESEVFTYVEFK